MLLQQCFPPKVVPNILVGRRVGDGGITRKSLGHGAQNGKRCSK
jgi:hypothetical protein